MGIGFWFQFMVVGSGFFGALHNDSHAVPVLGTVFGLMLCIVIFGGISGTNNSSSQVHRWWTGIFSITNLNVLNV